MGKFHLPVLLLLGLYLGLFNGRIALWDTEKVQPVEVFPYCVENYPPADQRALEKGIPVSDPARLEQLLEDLTS